MNRLMLSRLWKFVRNAAVAVCGLAIVVALLPGKARSQLGLDPCCAMMSVGLNTISGLLKGVVAKPLGSIQQNQQALGKLRTTGGVSYSRDYSSQEHGCSVPGTVRSNASTLPVANN